MAGLCLWVSTLIWAILATCHYSEAQISQNFLLESSSSHDNSIPEELSVFRKGKFQVTDPVSLKKSQYLAPESLLIVSPREAGLYPVLFFVHGTMVSNRDYSLLFKRIASHGYIVVAPQLFTLWSMPNQTKEIEMAASVINWLPSNLQKVLQERVVKGVVVKPDLQKLAVSGHSRGGKTAFALALGKIMSSETKLSVKISALIGVDPVAGRNNHCREMPYVLTYKPNSLNLSIPVTVIGTGLGSACPVVCAPSNVSHQQFFSDCKEGSHFVIKKYGHMQMLNDFIYDPVAVTMSMICTFGFGPKTTMRRTLGGIMVAFLDAYFKDDTTQYWALIANPSLAPTSLFVEKKGNFGFAPTYARM